MTDTRKIRRAVLASVGALAAAGLVPRGQAAFFRMAVQPRRYSRLTQAAAVHGTDRRRPKRL